MAQRDRIGMKPVHHRSPARSRLAKFTLSSPSLIEFLDPNPKPVRGWKIARQMERRRMYPWRGAPNRAFDRSCRTASATAGRDVSDGTRLCAGRRNSLRR